MMSKFQLVGRLVGCVAAPLALIACASTGDRRDDPPLPPGDSYVKTAIRRFQYQCLNPVGVLPGTLSCSDQMEVMRQAVQESGLGRFQCETGEDQFVCESSWLAFYPGLTAHDVASRMIRKVGGDFGAAGNHLDSSSNPLSGEADRLLNNQFQKIREANERGEIRTFGIVGLVMEQRGGVIGYSLQIYSQPL